MGGAFVAVADDSTATWWNPAGLAAGPFLDLALGRATTDTSDGELGHTSASWVALGTPPFGLSYYRLRVNEIEPSGATAQGPVDREEDEGTIRTTEPRSVSQVGATFVHTLVSGVHVGTTLKYLRGTTVQTGETHGAFDFDAGVLAVRGPIRVGGVVRNVQETEVGAMALSRQVRVGAAFSAAEAGLWPVTVAVDADVRAYRTASGDRRVVAVGGEGWMWTRRVAVRAGARFNTVGAEERALTAGATVAIRSGLYVDGHVVRGGARDERGWGVAARVSF